MGTQLQQYRLEEPDYRGTHKSIQIILLFYQFSNLSIGDRFKDVIKELKNNNDILNLTQPSIVTEVHEAYLNAGADIIETNTFNGQSISQSDYGLEALSYEINREAARLARVAADKVTAATPSAGKALGDWRLVAGAMGPTNRTASVSPKVEDPAFRNVTYMELVEAYKVQIEGLVHGGGKMLVTYLFTSAHNLHRDYLRHPERKGWHLCLQRVLRRIRFESSSSFHIRHPHRCSRSYSQWIEC